MTRGIYLFLFVRSEKRLRTQSGHVLYQRGLSGSDVGMRRRESCIRSPDSYPNSVLSASGVEDVLRIDVCVILWWERIRVGDASHVRLMLHRRSGLAKNEAVSRK